MQASEKRISNRKTHHWLSPSFCAEGVYKVVLSSGGWPDSAELAKTRGYTEAAYDAEDESI
jgi:hypothetical protein